MEQKQIESQFYRKLTMDMNQTFNKLSKIVNKTINSLHTASVLSSAFTCAIFEGFPLPNDLTKELKKNLSYIHNIFHLLTSFGSIDQKKLSSTPFFEEIISLFNQKINNKTKLKFKMYSAHGLYKKIYLVL